MGQFYTTEKIGPKQSLTPEGFLLCEDVPVARTGMMLYTEKEIPVTADRSGQIRVSRTDAELFNTRTMSSINGKPVVDDHPPEDVIPTTWKQLAVGSAFNPRRGTGAYDDLLLCDLLITDTDGILAVQEGKREISLGYDANYVETGVGEGYQKDILINHIALVEAGRCGLRCAIGDHKPTTERKEDEMPTPSKRVKLIRNAFATKDQKALDEALEGMEGSTTDEEGDEGAGETHVHVHLPATGAGGDTGGTKDPDGSTTFDAEAGLKEFSEKNDAEHKEFRDAIAGLTQEIAAMKSGGTSTGDTDEEKETKEAMKDEVPEDKKEEAMKARDSAFLGDSFANTVAMAEILVPGISVPTFDRAMTPVATTKTICNLRKRTLDLAYNQPATRDILEDLLAGKSIGSVGTMSCSAVKNLFSSAASVRRTRNNDSQRGSSAVNTTQQAGGKKIQTIADLNKANAEHWKDRS